jgi:hypothetical protein
MAHPASWPTMCQRSMPRSMRSASMDAARGSTSPRSPRQARRAAEARQINSDAGQVAALSADDAIPWMAAGRHSVKKEHRVAGTCADLVHAGRAGRDGNGYHPVASHGTCPRLQKEYITEAATRNVPSRSQKNKEEMIPRGLTRA